MLAVEFTVYRFVCDLATFTGLFSADADGRQIPDTAAFVCSWSRVPREKQALINPAQVKQVGASPKAFFKSLEPGMALTFSGAHASIPLNGDTTVLTFQIRPTEFEGGDIPVIAKGTLDPVPYFGKAKKNYAIKLRDASSQVIGKLLFSLEVVELDSDRDEKESSKPLGGSRSASSERRAVAPAPGTHAAGSSAGSRSRSNSGNNSSYNVSVHSGGGGSGGGGGGRNRAVPSPPAPPIRAPEALRNATPRVDDGIHRPKPTRVAGRQSPSSTGSPPASKLPSPGLLLMIERVSVKPDAIDLDHPAPLLLESEYYVKVRYGPQTYYTTPVVCRSPKEVLFGAQRIPLSLAVDGVPLPPSEKLRFSLWENNKQVAGFSLDPGRFRAGASKAKEYAIPFRYYPTHQSACLDVGVMDAGQFLGTTMARMGSHTHQGSHASHSPHEATHPYHHHQQQHHQHHHHDPSPGENTASSHNHCHRSPHHTHSHSHSHRRSRSAGSAVSAGSSRRQKTPPSRVVSPPVRPLGPPAPQHSHMQGREQQRSTNSPPPRPTNQSSFQRHQRPQQQQQQQQPLTGGQQPPLSAQQAARVTHHSTPAERSRSYPSDSNAAGPTVPKLVANRCDSSPRALGVPDTPPHDGSGSRSRCTPLRSCLPREGAPGVVASLPHNRGGGGRDAPVPSAAPPPPGNHPVSSKPTTSVLAAYVAKTEMAKHQNEAINSARKESAQLRRPTQSPPLDSPEDATGSARRRRHHAERAPISGDAGVAAAQHGRGHHSAGAPGSRHHSRRHRSRSPRDGPIADSSASRRQAATAAVATAAAPPTALSEHEKYLAEVMARLNRQARVPCERMSLVEEWLGWRDEASQRHSRCNSMISDRDRSPSVVGSVASREGSVASMASRRATPLPTKSFANSAMQYPYQPEYSRPRRPATTAAAASASASGTRGRPPLVADQM